MSLRHLIVAAVPLVVGCTDVTNPTPQVTPPATSSRARFGVDSLAAIHIVSPILDGPNVTVTAFNKFDAIAGYATKAGTLSIFRYRGDMQYFTPPAGYLPNTEWASGVGIDSIGNVASAIVSDTAQRAFIWTPTNQTYLLTPTYPFVGMFVGPDGCGATAMSPHGYITGYCDPFLDWYIAEWGPGHGLDTIQTSCCGSIDGFGLAISDNQYITGYILNFGPVQAFRETNGNPNFDIIGYYQGKNQVSMGLAVNNNGYVAGWGIQGQPSDTCAQLWTNIRNMIKLSDYGQATGIDPWTNVVGWHRTGPGMPPKAFIWNPSTGLQDLPGLVTGGGQSAAVAINDVHHILGWATDSLGMVHTVIWHF